MKCRTCSAEIRWVRMASGKTMPVDARPSVIGNIEIDAKGVGVVVPRANSDRDRFVSHFTTCPDATKHRVAHA